MLNQLLFLAFEYVLNRRFRMCNKCSTEHRYNSGICSFPLARIYIVRILDNKMKFHQFVLFIIFQNLNRINKLSEMESVCTECVVCAMCDIECSIGHSNVR